MTDQPCSNNFTIFIHVFNFDTTTLSLSKDFLYAINSGATLLPGKLALVLFI